MRIVALVENTTHREDLTAEHGLSLYIEACGKRILFDAGQSEAFADNAAKLGIDLSRVDFAVLSHGHYDHGGGLRRFLEINTSAPIYLNRRAFGPYHNARGDYIGLDPGLAENSRVIQVEDDWEIAPGIRLYAANDRPRPYPTEPFGLTVRAWGTYCPDTFLHEQYLLMEEAGNRVCISGCSHKGILNITEWFRPDVLVGGFHFMKLDPDGQPRETLTRAARQLLTYPTVFHTGHCTGTAQYALLKTIMGPRLHRLTTGAEIRI